MRRWWLSRKRSVAAGYDELGCVEEDDGNVQKTLMHTQASREVAHARGDELVSLYGS